MRNGWTRRTRITLAFVCLGTLFGLMYPIVGGEYEDPVAILNGLEIGLLGSLFLSAFELRLQNPLNRKMRFAKRVALKSVAYTSFFIALVLLVFSINRSLFSGTSYLNYLKGEEFASFIVKGDFHIIVLYTLLASIGVIFTYQLSNKMGQGVLLNLIFGKYHKPRKEERIFMFLDLNDSTALAEKMGEIEYNEFLNEFFSDITTAILDTSGEIYRYVGDEVVITWRMREGLRNCNCIRTVYLAKKTIRRWQEKYLARFGVIPQFSAGLHCGSVVVGQVGDVKSQIVFHGKVLYEGGMIEKKCRTENCLFLVSEPLLAKLDLPDHYRKKEAGVLNPGHQGELMLFTVERL